MGVRAQRARSPRSLIHSPYPSLFASGACEQMMMATVKTMEKTVAVVMVVVLVIIVKKMI